jgi:hypothetical protein
MDEPLVPNTRALGSVFIVYAYVSTWFSDLYCSGIMLNVPNTTPVLCSMVVELIAVESALRGFTSNILSLSLDVAFRKRSAMLNKDVIAVYTAEHLDLIPRPFPPPRTQEANMN